MLDLPRYERIKLSARPLFQRVIGLVMLAPNYNLPPRLRIVFEGLDRVPDHPVIFAMNHTDRYNYWPFQYKLWRKANRFTATWVKGKYYESALLGRFMEWVNSIPTPSRGYLVTKDFLAATGALPSDGQYRALRTWVDAAASNDQAAPAPDVDDLPRTVLEEPRDVFGRPFDPSIEDYPSYINAIFARMTARFVSLHDEAFAKGLDLLIFPQGTRSLRLSRGRIGLAQIALKYDKTVVPVGCNGSNRVYPGGSPLAKGGRIVYRFGEPISDAEVAPFRIDEPFEPFTEAAQAEHSECFQGLTDVVMDRINDLLDPPYQYAEDAESDGTRGSKRFV